MGTSSEKTLRHMPNRAELHAHLGSSVDPAILWSIAHAQGIRLPSKDFWDFEAMITMKETEKNKDLDDMHYNFFHWTELIQSSPLAVEEAVKSVIGGGYRKCNLVLQELRFNPMFRNRGGEQDLDHIIMAALRGMDKAILEYPQVKAGLILMMDRMLTLEQNSVIVDKAIKYQQKGIIGVDLAGPQRDDFSIKEHAVLFDKAKKAGLGTTIHTGEEGSIDELMYVIKHIQPDRIGHGLLCVSDENIMREIVRQNITLETCPTSNLRNAKVKDIKELSAIIQAYKEHNIKFTINTDGPEMYRTNVCIEEELLIENGILDQIEIEQCRKNAFSSSFIR